MKTPRPAGSSSSAALVLALLSWLPNVARGDDAGGAPDAGAPEVASAADSGSPDGGAYDGGAPGDGGLASEAGAPAATPEPSAEPVAEPAGVGTKPPRGNRGAVVGVVVDGKTGESMIEAQVTVVGTKRKTLTDLEGNYRLDLPPGTYELRVWAELKAARRIRGVEIERGKVVRLDVKLDDDSKAALKEIVIVTAPDKATEAVQVVRRQKAATVSDAVSAEQISRSPDSNASEAVKRVVGATIQDGKYVIIRGLGGRYSLTLLNGVSLPSPDPDLPSAPLDLFPAALLANLTIAKTFTPDIPGNFAGGALMIESRDFPSKFTLKLRVGTSASSQGTFRKVNTYDGGGLDFLGYDDRTRKLPSAVPRDKLADDNNLDENQLNSAGQSFRNNWELYKHRALPNLGLGVTVGDTRELGGRKLGYLATVSYSNRWSRQKEHLAGVGELLADGTRLPHAMQLDNEIGAQNASLGALANVGLMLSSAHRLSLISLYTHTGENTATVTTGKEENENIVNRLRFRFLERALSFTQLLGEDSFGGGKVLLAWQGNIAYVSQKEPDTRDLLRVRDNTGTYQTSSGAGTSDRLYGDLGEITGGGSLDLTIPFHPVRFKLGGSAMVASRESRVRKFHFEVDSSLATLPSEQIFAESNFHRGGVVLDELTRPLDAFDADRGIFAGYAMADLLSLDPLRLIGGVRYEVSQLDLTLGNSVGSTPENLQHLSRTDKKPLPALNVVYALTARSNLRAAYSITVARPHLRELSEQQYVDYVRRRVLSGNSKLEETSIQNADLRWEMFFDSGELLAASLFYKHFDKPIERTIATTGNLNFRNADSARSLGLELEARLTGARFSPALSPLYLGANLALVNSRIKAPMVDRPLQGQSPYSANAELGFRKGKTQVALLYNLFGPRVSEVALQQGNTDVLEEPVHRLDISWSQGLGRGLTLKLSATNLLDQRTVFSQNDVEILAYKQGVSGLATLEWSYEN